MTPRTRSRKSATAALSAAAPAARHHPVHDPIITMNAGGIIQSASDSVEHVFGWTPTELYGRNVSVLVPEPRRSALDRYLDRYRNADGAKSLQRSRRFGAVRKDGSHLQIELSMSRADLPSVSSPFFIGIIRDVSSDIDVGSDSPAERTRLQHLITEQTRALATANLRLQLADRLASIGTLAAGLGHDMNNVLLPVRARLNALEHTGITDTALGHITAVRRSIAYLQKLSDGLHFLALDPDGPGVAEGGDGTTEVAHWWSQVGSLLRKTLPKQVTVLTSVPNGLPPVNIAPHWLTQAMLNLIVNAGEAMTGGRRPGRVRIWATTSQDGKFVRLGVTDNGRGMSHYTQRRAFDLFFTTKARGMGTGLGLPLARKVAIRAGGDVEVKSEPGKGTSVVLVLPIAPPSTVKTASRSRHKPVAAVSISDHRAAGLITQILIAGGAVVTATKRIGVEKADIWVTDPTPKSLATAAQWRKRHIQGTIVLLGSPAKSAFKRWSELGATVIEQPDDFEVIRHTLGLALSRRSDTSIKSRKTAI